MRAPLAPGPKNGPKANAAREKEANEIACEIDKAAKAKEAREREASLALAAMVNPNAAKALNLTRTRTRTRNRGPISYNPNLSYM